MSQPGLNITELDGALGVLPPSAGKLYAVVGNSTQGPIAQPATFARVKDLISTFGRGPAVETAAYYVQRYGRPVVFIRTDETTPGGYEAASLDTSEFAGDSTPSTGAGSEPDDDYEVMISFVSGGTIGSAGITYQWSLDGGRTMSPVTALGTDDSIELEGGVVIDFGPGDVEDGDIVRVRTTAPKWNTTQLTTALEALGESQVSWEIVHVTGPIEATDAVVIDTVVGGLGSKGKYRSWIGSVRMPKWQESRSAYQSDLETEFGQYATVIGTLCAGAARTVSGVSGRIYRRPTAVTVGARLASVSEEVNIAEIDLGPLPGVSLYDSNGNPVEHDESLFPGLDDARFTVLRTWSDVAGIYVNRPRIFAPHGSDFELIPHRRVADLAKATARPVLIRRLNKPVRVHKDTGFILEQDALQIEALVLRALESALLAKPKASGVQFSVSRTDNLLSTKTMSVSGRVIPLAYPEWIDFDFGLLNPALQLVAV